MKYEYLKDLTSDIAFKAYGDSLKEVLENSAEALSAIVCDIEKVSNEKTISITAEGENSKELLFNWLQQIIAEIDIEQLFLSKFNITLLENNKLTAECSGEPISDEKSGTLVKSLTNHLFNLEEKDNKFIATVCVDI